MKRIILAFQFLTIIPVRVRGSISEREMAESAAFFPVVGAFQGVTAGSVAFVATKLFPEELAGGLVILTLVLTNGGFHLDGLSDTFDALAVKQSGDDARDIEKRLSVMRESSIGAMGATAIVFTILLQFLLVGSLLKFFQGTASLSLISLMSVFSKWAMIPLMYHGTSARKEGLGRVFIDTAGKDTLLLSTLFLILFCTLTFLCLFPRAYRMTMAGLVLFLAAMHYLLSLLSVRFFSSRFGGVTGDHFGALNEISEILFLTVAIPWLRLSIS